MSAPPTLDEINAYLAETMPNDPATVELFEPDHVRVRRAFDPATSRPGGYISGPTIMSLVDLTAWVAVFSRAGIVPMAVTWELKINFLRPAIGGDLIAGGHLHKFGTFSFIEVPVHMDGTPDKLVAHATVTYAVPPPS